MARTILPATTASHPGLTSRAFVTGQIALEATVARTRLALQRIDDKDRDRGGNLLEYVIIAGVVCGLAIALGVIITNAVQRHQTSIR
ncbi:hypothetical protein ACTHRK_17345 [Dietzia cercidiphylli]|jgi:hypothetical protein|uniref:hypothetical protein n=1 Tax=Dietzia cercidiphylli TaxID=498199 RepID=UPI003F81CEBB